MGCPKRPEKEPPEQPPGALTLPDCPALAYRMGNDDIPARTRKRCFVVMGFGIKTDYATGRKLDLNKSYRLLIKPTVEAKQCECIRADEIRHSGTIDLPMYSELLNADLVIADLSTANPNAIYELGVRHALRPFSTIVISEDKLAYPFDLNHISITSYTHLGDAIDYDEVERFRKVLGDTIDAVLDRQQADSPVYTFLGNLRAPSLSEQEARAVAEFKDAMAQSGPAQAQRAKGAEDGHQIQKTLALLMEEGEEALRKNAFAKAKLLFKSSLDLWRALRDDGAQRNDSYLIHRLALATQKAAEPNVIDALKEALALLGQLDLDHTNDSETVALAGGIEKKLFENGQGEAHLANAILFYERGYFLLNNRFNSINLAYTFNCRVDTSLFSALEDKIADMAFASRVRRRALTICERDLSALKEREDREAAKGGVLSGEEAERRKADINEQRFWILANRAEAYFGLGEFKAYKESLSGASALEHEAWMMESFNDQLARLRKLLEKYGNLMNPKWACTEI